MTTALLRPSDPRPSGVPFYIANKCDDCGGLLVTDPNNRGWLDEFICPICNNGIYLDIPKEMSDRILSQREATWQLE